MFDTYQVPPIGPLSAPIAFCGEAPGENEASTGLPFVGRSGQLLDQLLASAGLNRAGCYITNVVKERPPRNDISTFVDFSTKEPTCTSAYLEYEKALHAELAQCEANVIVPLGNVAMWALLRRTGITKCRGSVYEIDGQAIGCSALNGRKVIPTLHPATALEHRDPLNKFIILCDLARIKREAETPGVHNTEQVLHILPTFNEALDYLALCGNQALVGFDIETSMTNCGTRKAVREMTVFSLALDPCNAMAIPLINPDGSHLYSLEDELRLLKALAGLLQNPHVTKVGQNLAFDCSVLYQRYGIYIDPIEDTMLAQHVIYPELPKDLGFLCSLYTNTPYYKDTGGKVIKGGKPTAAEWEGFQRYAALDAAVVLEMLPQLHVELERKGNMPTYHKCVGTIGPFVGIEESGFLLDSDSRKQIMLQVRGEVRVLQDQLNEIYWKKVQRVAPDVMQEVADLRADIAASVANGKGVKGKQAKLKALTTFNVKSSKQKLYYFYKLCKQAQPQREPTNQKAIKKLISKGVPGAKHVATITQLRDDDSKYYSAPIDPDGRIRTRFNPGGTYTGRASTSSTNFGTGVAFQTQPKRMKSLFLADPGTILINIDLAQAENRMVAYLASEHTMIEAFESNADVHCLTAGLVFGKPPEEVSRVPGSSMLGDGLHSERDWGKRANHALNYGMGYLLLASEYEIPNKDAKWLYTRYHQAYPNVSFIFWHEVRDTLWKARELTNLKGRTMVFLGQLNDKLLKSGYAFRPQSTVPDIVNEAMLAVYDRAEQFPHVQLRNQVHDSLVYQFDLRGPTEELVALLALLKQHLEQPLTWHGRTFHIPADAEMGYNCGTMFGFPLGDANVVEDMIDRAYWWAQANGEILGGTRSQAEFAGLNQRLCNLGMRNRADRTRALLDECWKTKPLTTWKT